MLKNNNTKQANTKQANNKQANSAIILVPDRYNYRDKDYSASKILAELETEQEQQEQKQKQDDQATEYVLELMLAVDSLSKIVDGLVTRIEMLETRRKLIR